MISKMKGIMSASDRIDAVSKSVSTIKSDMKGQSEEIASFCKEAAALRAEVKRLADEQSKFAKEASAQLDALKSARQDLEKEVYDFKLIKADIKSRLVADLTDDFRAVLKKEAEKLDTDVKRFNELKDELSHLVGKFRSVEDEIAKFKSIAGDVKAADFQLARHAKELTQADSEKLKLLQKIDQLEHLVSKMRRSAH
ncbi:hypothetical protein KY363_06090 [Candidatus Woesearchaeota archaeon]|nr:hypothetical protein [Candidatus Woesearchaeota archaeon]